MITDFRYDMVKSMFFGFFCVIIIVIRRQQVMVLVDRFEGNGKEIYDNVTVTI